MQTYSSRVMVVLAALLALGACSGGRPAVILDTAAGPVPLNSAASAEIAAPPPGMEPRASSSGQGRDGMYAGTADVLTTGGGLCLQNRQVTNFRVRGDAVRFGVYRGRIDADGGLQMVYGQNWIVGQFEGATFHGQFEIPGRFGSPGCSYLLSLARVGP